MKTRLQFPALIAVASLAACSDMSGPAASAPADPIDVHVATAKTSSAIENSYIVTLSDNESDPDRTAKDLLAGIKGKGKLKHIYKSALKGFAIEMSADEAADMSELPGVVRVEQDVEMSVSTTDSPVASWGLDRLDQRALPLSNSFTFTSTGSGVRVYIVDTGILPGHQEFGGRANTTGYTAIADGNGTVDCNGHGTHVAGTVAGATTGIARSAQLYAVRVLGCGGSGSTTGVIAGIDFVVSQKNANPGVPMVANMSLGGGLSASLNDAVERAVAAGVVFAVAAGNDNVDACTQSPAAAPSALTVGATDKTDVRAYYSNYGRCLDIFAPGSGIVSSYYSATNAYASMSGTSMASPHVAGVAAVILGDSPNATPAQVRSAMLTAATSDVVSSPGNLSPNLLLSNLLTTVSPPPQNEPTPISSLTVTSTRSGNKTNMNLAWNRGTTGGSVDVYRSSTSGSRGSRLTTTTNDGGYTDSRVSFAYYYTVCQGAVCTNQAKAQ